MRELLRAVKGRESLRSRVFSPIDAGSGASRYIEFQRNGGACYRIVVRVRRARTGPGASLSDFLSHVALDAPPDSALPAAVDMKHNNSAVGQGESNRGE